MNRHAMVLPAGFVASVNLLGVLSGCSSSSGEIDDLDLEPASYAMTSDVAQCDDSSGSACVLRNEAPDPTDLLEVVAEPSGNVQDDSAPTAVPPGTACPPAPSLGTWGGTPLATAMGNITVQQCTYTPGSYVCSNFANGFWWQAQQNGLNAAIFSFGCTTVGHAINAIQTDCTGCASDMQRYCLIEPQTGAAVACWVQRGGAPTVPSFVYGTLQACYPWYRACIAAGDSRNPPGVLYATSNDYRYSRYSPLAKPE
ncbi:hypothetical protein WME79_36580 [Sorangium sp. So ce726]|uniref:hypothetical protein n=1 Tax=Sorangium sp. So ce726 TaxID=3133319 RepID=UPI003F62BB3A